MNFYVDLLVDLACSDASLSKTVLRRETLILLVMHKGCQRAGLIVRHSMHRAQKLASRLLLRKQRTVRNMIRGAVRRHSPCVTVATPLRRGSFAFVGALVPVQTHTQFILLSRRHAFEVDAPFSFQKASGKFSILESVGESKSTVIHSTKHSQLHKNRRIRNIDQVA